MTDRPSIAADSTAARANAQLILDFFDIVLGAGHGTDRINQFLSPQFIDHDPTGGDSGFSGVAAKLDGLWSALPDARYVPDAVVAAGELVTVRSRLVAHLNDPSGAPGVAFADTYRVVDGLVAEHWHVVDTAALTSLLG